MPVIHSRLTDDELNELTKIFNKKLESYPSHKITNKIIKSAVDEYKAVVFDRDLYCYDVYLFDDRNYILGVWSGCGVTMIESVKMVVEMHESIYYDQWNEFRRWDGDLTKL